MWIILFFACVSVILPNNAQEQTSFEAQTVTEASYSNNDNWDLKKPHVLVTIQNGRTDSTDQSLPQNSARPLIYSNEYKPVIMQMPYEFNRNADSNRFANDNERSVDYSFVPTFLRRPDSETNSTVPNLYSQVGERYGFSNVPVSYTQIPYFQTESNYTSEALTTNSDQVYSEIQPNENLSANTGDIGTLDLYRIAQHFSPPAISLRSASQPNLYSNARNFEIHAEPKQTSSSAIPEYTNSDSIFSRTNDQVSKSLSNEEQIRGLEISKPINFYRNSGRFLPPMVQAYYPPYPFLPFQGDGTFQPMMPYPQSYPRLDRQTGREFDDRISETSEKPILPENISDQIAENVPSATTTDSIPPPQSLPFPVRGYPFGLYPSPYVPPLVPNIPPYGFAFNPLPVTQPRNVPREAIVPDESLLPPAVPITTVPEIAPEFTPNIENLATEEQAGVLTDLPVNPEEVIIDEEPKEASKKFIYGYDMTDGKGNDQHRKEESDGFGVVRGSYAIRDRSGIYRLVNYIADKNGFRAFINSNEPGVASSGSADVVVVAERPPPRAIAEEAEREIIAALDPAPGVIAPGGIPAPE